MLRKLLLTIGALFTLSLTSLAQQGALQGKVVDAGTGEPLPFVNVIVERNGVLVTGASSDFDGKYSIKPITPGAYTIKATFTGYKPVQVNGITVNSDKTTFYDIKMSSSVEQLEEFEVIEYTVPLISKDNTASGGTITSEDIQRMPGRSAASIAQTVGGVYSKDDGSSDLNIRGSRDDANYYFIDGIKVRGSNSLPQSAIEQVTVITGGLPAQYGDITGGVISITTRGPSSTYFGQFEYVTSGYKFGDNVYGLDNYGYNLLEFSLSGPLWMKKDTAGNKTKPLVGFFLSGNATSIVDASPSAIGVWRTKDEFQDQLDADPLRASFSGSGAALQNAEFTRLNNVEKVRFKQNAARRGMNIAGKLDFSTSSTTNFTVGGNLNYSQRHRWLYDYSMFNSHNNPERRETTWRVFARFTQRFNSATPSEEERSAATIKNAYYSIQADYSQFNFLEWDDSHKDNFFRYGYYGRFQTLQSRDYAPGVDSLTGIPGLIQQTFVDTLVVFTPGTDNPEGAAYTQRFYDLNIIGFDDEGNPIYDSEVVDNFVNIRTAGGYVNGDFPRDIYGLFRSNAYQFNLYDRRSQNQFRVTATGSADIKNHAISVGFEYEQRVDRRFAVSPVGLWTIGRQLTNNHIQNLDFENPDIQYFGTFPIINYERQNAAPGAYQGGDPQSFFDFNLRNELGLDPDGVDFIDFDSYDPDRLKLDFFSADELLNNGSSYVSYYGYDHTGGRQNGSPSFDDFFTETDEFGNFTRPIDAYRPIYIAGYIQDKFSFDDLVFNIGVRIDRFDANQQVLRDPFVLFPTVRAGEAEALALTETGAHPTNVGNDYVVYVDNVENPSSIVGYRDGDTWFNSEGTEIDDPSILRSASGIAPLLVDKENTSSQDITSSAFEDYQPQINVMPRIAFSFPISDEALFFAHYDVLTKRPTTGARLDPTDYYFINANPNTPRNNPDLKPERTIDYEVGFQQKLTNSSSIKISGFYRELRDMVQVVNRVEAYPRTYLTYENIDFGTVKGMTVSYDLRRTGNIWMRAAYTLQFAEGTGSTATTGLTLARAGLNNIRNTNALTYDQRHTITATIDYRYGSGRDYNGPIWFGKQIFANTGTNLVFNGGSGEPYSARSNVTGRAYIGPQQGLLDGGINGSRLPWQFRIDARIDKDIEVNLGKDDEQKKPIQVNVYLQILNLLNTKNVIGVYGATGNPDDDGYLQSAIWQNDIINSTNETSLRELYSLKVNNPSNYNLPRRMRLGVLVNF
ncbi:MAG: TonB-dependent receptor domain-containing protein [Salibacteraceae bacterium]